MKEREYDIEFLSSNVPDVKGEELALALSDALVRCKGRSSEFGPRTPHYAHSKFMHYFHNRFDDSHAAYVNATNSLIELEAAIGYCHATTKLQKLLYSLYKQEFNAAYSSTADEFRRRYQDCQALVVHLSCMKYHERAASSARSFDECSLGNIIVVGNN
jgi:hypothetical protein